MPTTETEIKQMIDEAAALDTQIKAMSEPLKGLKEGLTDWFLGGDQEKRVKGFKAECTFSVAEVFDPVNVSALFDVMKKYGLEGRLFDVVTVNMAELKKYLPGTEIEKLRCASVGKKVSLRFKSL